MNKPFDIAFIDFDYTLFHTKELVEKVDEVFASFGIQGEKNREILERAVRGNSGLHFNYSFERHAQLAQEEFPDISQEKLLKKLYTLKDLSFQYKDAEPFLVFTKSIAKKVVLMTAGNPEFQQQKLNTTNLEQYFDDKIFCFGDKQKEINAYKKENEQILFVNDNTKENNAVKETCNNCVIVGLKNSFKYSDDEYTENNLPYFASLSDVQTYIASII